MRNAIVEFDGRRWLVVRCNPVARKVEIVRCSAERGEIWRDVPYGDVRVVFEDVEAIPEPVRKDEP